MCNLTDLTSKELAIISEAIATRIDDLNVQIKFAEKFCPEGPTLERVTEDDRNKLPVLREFHVQLIQAKQVVREREKVTEN